MKLQVLASRWLNLKWVVVHESGIPGPPIVSIGALVALAPTLFPSSLDFGPRNILRRHNVLAASPIYRVLFGIITEKYFM